MVSAKKSLNHIRGKGGFGQMCVFIEEIEWLFGEDKDKTH